MANNIKKGFHIYCANSNQNLNDLTGFGEAVNIVYRPNQQGLFESWVAGYGSFNFFNSVEVNQFYLISANAPADFSNTFGEAGSVAGNPIFSGYNEIDSATTMVLEYNFARPDYLINQIGPINQLLISNSPIKATGKVTVLANGDPIVLFGNTAAAPNLPITGVVLLYFTNTNGTISWECKNPAT